jgi:hypothetical protein
MPIQFPSNATTGQTHQTGGQTWIYDGTAWSAILSGATGATGPGADLSSVSSNIVPAANVTYDLGAGNLRWRDLYLSGNTIDLGGTAIKSTANGVSFTSAANAQATVPLTVSSIQLGTGGNTLTLSVGAGGLQTTGPTGNAITVGGGATVTVSNTAPTTPSSGTIWYDTETGDTYVFYANSWAEVGAGSVPGATGVQGATGIAGNVGPQGATGLGATGATGVAGATGLTGATGPAGTGGGAGANVTISPTPPTTNLSSGQLWFNSERGDLNLYYGNSWVVVGGSGGSVPTPTIVSVSGGIYNGVASTLTVLGSNFGLSQGTVRFSFNQVVKDVLIVPVSTTQFTVTVPSEIYTLSSNVTGNISWFNAFGTQSNGYVMTTQGNPYPTGGTITISGGYRIHTFTSSGSFVVSQTGFPSTAEVLLVAGGGGGGRWGGGGGAGGLLYYGTETPKTPNGSSVIITPQTYAITIGAGGSGHVGDAQSGGHGGSGSNTTGFGYTSIGGGGGGNYGQTGLPGPGLTGGSSGGGGSNGPNYNGTTRGNTAATAGQGNTGGLGGGNYGTSGGGGGGGAGAAGKDYTNGLGPLGGDGLQYGISGTNTYYGGGGAGVMQGTSTLYGPSLGGGGRGGGGSGVTLTSAQVDGVTNTGGGGGGTQDGVVAGTTRAGNGGSGIVIIRYAI